MGLAASQCRMLLLTGRRNDVEADLMKISNQLMLLSRDSSNISEKYSNSLNKTKLTWNAGPASMDLTYDLLMRPNAYAGSGQYVLTNTSNGRVLLNNYYINALGLPSSGAAGAISSAYSTSEAFAAKMIGCSVDELGEVADPVEVSETAGKTMSINDFLKDLNSVDFGTGKHVLSNNFSGAAFNGSGASIESLYNSNALWVLNKDENDNDGFRAKLLNNSVGKLNSEFLDNIVSSLKGNPSYNSEALEIARYATMAIFKAALSEVPDQKDNSPTDTVMQNGIYTKFNRGGGKGVEDCAGVTAEAQPSAEKFNSIIYWNNSNGANDASIYAVNVKNVINTFFTYYAAALAGKLTAAKDSSGNVTGINEGISYKDGVHSLAGVSAQSVTKSTYATTVKDYDENTDTTPPDNSGTKTYGYTAKYYMNLYNAINSAGWQSSDNLDSEEYLQNQVLYGSVTIKQLNSSGGWSALTSSSATSPLSSETDEQYQEQAERDYEAEKDKITYKETRLNLRKTMLDAELSSVNTEMQSVSKLLEKHYEDFKLFQNG